MKHHWWIPKRLQANNRCAGNCLAYQALPLNPRAQVQCIIQYQPFTQNTTREVLLLSSVSQTCSNPMNIKLYLHLGQVEVWARAALKELLGVVEEEQREVEDGGRHGLAVHVHVLLQQVPPARPHEQHRRLRSSACLGFAHAA